MKTEKDWEDWMEEFPELKEIPEQDFVEDEYPDAWRSHSSKDALSLAVEIQKRLSNNGCETEILDNISPTVEEDFSLHPTLADFSIYFINRPWGCDVKVDIYEASLYTVYFLDVWKDLVKEEIVWGGRYKWATLEGQSHNANAINTELENNESHSPENHLSQKVRRRSERTKNPLFADYLYRAWVVADKKGTVQRKFLEFMLEHILNFLDGDDFKQAQEIFSDEIKKALSDPKNSRLKKYVKKPFEIRLKEYVPSSTFSRWMLNIKKEKTTVS